MVRVYRIVNNCTGKCLIGTTQKEDLKDVLKEWIKNCQRKNKFADYLIAQDYDKYGKASFEIEELISCKDKQTAHTIADRYIDEYSALEPLGYNKRYVGTQSRKREVSKDALGEEEKIIKEGIIDKEFRHKEELIKEYGIVGLTSNNIPQELVADKTIKALRNFADKLEKYGNKDVYEVVPTELNEEANLMKEILKGLIDGKSEGKISKETYLAVPKNSKQCYRCGKFRGLKADYYLHPDKSATGDGYISICKQCIDEYATELYEVYGNALYTMIVLCQVANIIFVQSVAEKAAASWIVQNLEPSKIFQFYMTELRMGFLMRDDAPSSMLEFRHSNFQGNVFNFCEHNPATPRVFIKELNKNLVIDDTLGKSDQQETIESKWGVGFTPQEYKQLEQEYEKLEKFLPKKTELHIEALKKYVIYSLKEKTALAKGDLKEVKEWNGLADKAADNAQLKIKQLSESFGSEVDGFATLVEAVEEYASVIPVLPKVRRMPYDDIDFIIWEIVNYTRRLEGKPETSYEEVYDFIDSELTKKMIDSGMSQKQVEKAKIERNAVFNDLSDNYIEPLWLLSDSEEEEDSSEEGEQDG